MPDVSDERIRAFNDKIQKCIQRIGGGKVGIAFDDVCATVRSDKDAAYRYVEIHCLMAASQPGYLQPALVVANAYQVEYRDDSAIMLVNSRADELDAHSHLEGISSSANMMSAATEPEEREAARSWWRSSAKTEGICDGCTSPMRRGDGYLIDGRRMMVGDMKINLGAEILCHACFQEVRSDPREPSGHGDHYFEIE